MLNVQAVRLAASGLNDDLRRARPVRTSAVLAGPLFFKQRQLMSQFLVLKSFNAGCNAEIGNDNNET